MVLADTSVWIDHFRRGSRRLADELDGGRVAIHSVVVGELASGNLPGRPRTLADLRALPRVDEAGFEECLHFIDLHRLAGTGLGWSDVQLLASAKLSRIPLWSADRRLGAAAARLGTSFNP